MATVSEFKERRRPDLVPPRRPVQTALRDAHQIKPEGHALLHEPERPNTRWTTPSPGLPRGFAVTGDAPSVLPSAPSGELSRHDIAEDELDKGQPLNPVLAESYDDRGEERQVRPLPHAGKIDRPRPDYAVPPRGHDPAPAETGPGFVNLLVRMVRDAIVGPPPSTLVGRGGRQPGPEEDAGQPPTLSRPRAKRNRSRADEPPPGFRF